MGACPACRGFGRVIAIDYNAAIPDRAKTLAGGAVKPWQTKTGADCQEDLKKFARLRQVPLDVAFRDLPGKFQDWVIEGDPGYGQDKAHEWPRAWYGVKGYFRWLESKAYKMHVRVLLARYRKYKRARPARARASSRRRCFTGWMRRRGGDLNSTARGRLPDRWTRRRPTLADFYRLPVGRRWVLLTG